MCVRGGETGGKEGDTEEGKGGERKKLTHGDKYRDKKKDKRKKTQKTVRM